MTYQSVLPTVFAVGIIAPREFVLDCVQALTGDKWSGHESSFAVTSDAGLGELCLWLSETSRERLYQDRLAQRGAFG